METLELGGDAVLDLELDGLGAGGVGLYIIYYVSLCLVIGIALM